MNYEPIYLEKVIVPAAQGGADAAQTPANLNMKLSLGTFYFIDGLGVKGGELQGMAAFDFLKTTDHGRQVDLSNLGFFFHSDTKFEDISKDIQLTLSIPPLDTVYYKHNKHNRKRKFNASLFSEIKVSIDNTTKDATTA
jgi:hypothetical protein